MKVRRLLFAAVTCASLFIGCRCGDQANNIKPSLSVGPTQLDFGKVKVGKTAELVGTLNAQTNTSVSITSWTINDGDFAGTSTAFSMVEKPDIVPPLDKASYRIRFSPTELRAYDGVLVIANNDPLHPSFEIPVTGEGAHPVMTVTPECSAALSCKGTVVESPPSIDFGAQPFERMVPIPATELPKINVINDSEVELVLSKIAIEGTDASAFTFVTGGNGLPDFPLTLAAGEGLNLSIRFQPTSDTQMDYSAQVVIEGDDPDHPSVTVPLTGKLGPNLPPVVCANIVKVKPKDEAQLNYDSKAFWDPLLVAPMGGYDFTTTRDIRPNALVTFSATSDSANPATCTTDPEDQRTGLTYQWDFTQWPEGAKKPVMGAATTATPSFTPVASGAYEVSLTVKDAQGHPTTTTLRFAAVLKEDLVVELSWNGDMNAYAGVDLDLHLVRPSSTTQGDAFSGVFSFFDEGTNATTSGDVNGFSNGYRLSHTGVDFSWGGTGVADDPHLNVDDKGGGALIENISLNYPEDDPDCATAACAYKVVVHYFNDTRVNPNPPACVVTSGTCVDGEACTCTGTGEKCVAATAPKGAPATGVGKCYVAPKPVVRIFVKANPTPAAVIPLDTLMPADELQIGAPCQALYVADIVWPSKKDLMAADGGMGADGGAGPLPTIDVKGADATGRITAPVFARFGVRQAGGLQCSPNTTRAGSAQDNWYAEEPR